MKLTARVECGASIHAIFQLTVRRIQMFFSLKPSQFQGESKFQLAGVRRAVSEELGNIQTDRLTHWQTGAFKEWLIFELLTLYLSILKI